MITCYEVNHEPWAVDIFQCERSLERKVSRLLAYLHCEVFDRVYQSLELAVARYYEAIVIRLHFTFQIRFCLCYFLAENSTLLSGRSAVVRTSSWNKAV